LVPEGTDVGEELIDLLLEGGYVGVYLLELPALA
jgi:hypothetical protein